MKRLKDIDYKIISELIKNSKISDRKLAKVVGISQPTVTRKRAMFEKEELLDYTAIPNFRKFGFEIMAFNFYSWNPEANVEYDQDDEKFWKKLSTFLSKHPNIIFASKGRGFGMQRIMISFHKNYADYSKLMDDVEKEYGRYLAKSEAFIISLKSDVIPRCVTFKHLGDYLKKIA